jgi:hypothetical protein
MIGSGAMCSRTQTGKNVRLVERLVTPTQLNLCMVSHVIHEEQKQEKLENIENDEAHV